MFPTGDTEPPIELGLNRPARASVPDADSLQFRKVESSTGRTCAICREGIPGEYFQIGGADACPRCAQARLAYQQQQGGWSGFGRAALFGLGAAAAGSALFAIVTLAIHMQFSLLSIVVGIMVAKAVVHGSRGGRGRKYQILAVLLTYGSITASYIPVFISAISKQVSAKDQKKDQAAPKQAKPKVTAVGLILALFILIGLSLIAPFLGLTSVGGLLTLLIIFFGLSRAWRGTAADEMLVAGPYSAAEAAGAGS